VGRVKRVIGPSDSEWPAHLNELGPHRPPAKLFAEGRPLHTGAPRVAIVGTRRPTAAGMEMARNLAASLAEAGVVVVSGMAVGIDAAAHQSTLKAGGRTIAVLGCGLDVAYPGRNVALKNRVAQEGTLLSEYPDGTPPERHNFPMRNRIIAGLSLGVVVVEGALTSGALVTARLAIDANRNVYAVPGSTRNPMAAGPNELIRTSQALLVTSVEHIFEDLAPNLLTSISNGRVDEGRACLSDEEHLVLSTLDDVPTVLDALGSATGLAHGRLAVILSTLEVKALVARGRGGYCLSDAGARALTRAS
jgi:DNA processing protein